MKGRLAKLVLASGAVASPGIAWAQAGAGSPIVIDPWLDRGDVAGARTEPAFQPRAIHIGPLFALPSVSVLGGYESNVFNRAEARPDAVLRIVPRLTLQADLPRHDLSFAAVGSFRRFARQQSENSEAFSLRSKGRIDLAEGQSIEGAVEYAHEIEPRSSAGSAVDAAEPVSFRRFAAELGARLQRGDWHLVPGASFARTDYSPLERMGGGETTQDFRDARTAQGRLAIEYDFTGLVSGFAEGRLTDVDSTLAPSSQRRDSRGYSVMAGLRGTVTPVIFAEVGLGYESRDYELPRYRDFGGITFRADVQWYVTPLVTLRLEAGQRFENSGNPEVAGILSDKVTISGYYDPLRNLRFGVSAGFDYNRYRELGTRAYRKSVGIQAQYLLNRALSIGAHASFLRQDVRGPAIVNEFTSFGAGVGMTLAL
jgi:hypothetical protein